MAWILGAGLLAFGSGASMAANPLSVWKERLFGERTIQSPIREASPEGVVLLGLKRPERLRIGPDADQRDFPKGKSRYREIELQREFEHVALRIQVLAQPNPKGRGNVVFNPIVYVIGDDDKVRDSKPADPLVLDIRPFKPTRLLACIPLDKVRRIAVATPESARGKSYESKARDKVKASSKDGFFYATDPVKVSLPYADTGDLIVEVIRADNKGEGC
ncbi:MAG TPA: hypothetical protein PLR28_06920 [Dokdonella sp.]|nr:hypothetical protein [Dokdonella sp.]